MSPALEMPVSLHACGRKRGRRRLTVADGQCSNYANCGKYLCKSATYSRSICDGIELSQCSNHAIGGFDGAAWVPGCRRGVRALYRIAGPDSRMPLAAE